MHWSRLVLRRGLREKDNAVGNEEQKWTRKQMNVIAKRLKSVFIPFVVVTFLTCCRDSSP